MTAHTPNLPALIAVMPDPGSEPEASHRKPHTEFTRERQVAFLENLSVTGSVRSAASSAQVSHQTAYRARRGQAAFRLAWDAAMVAARANADAVLASRAIDGVEEKVFYHGEVIDTRVRYSDRLLLAHLARLDRLTADARTQAFADDWDGAMERFARGEDPVAEAPHQSRPEEPEKSSPGPCNNRSMSPAETDDDLDPRMRARVAAMEQARPFDAAPPDAMSDDEDEVAEIEHRQMVAFEMDLPEWWTIATLKDFDAACASRDRGEGDAPDEEGDEEADEIREEAADDKPDEAGDGADGAVSDPCEDPGRLSADAAAILLPPSSSDSGPAIRLF